ncbi:hypothetical protein [Stakelama pacifica]|nr:hypothetical protein [Stakelama pacifica]
MSTYRSGMAPNYPKSIRDRADVYINAMHELRVRIQSIEAIMDTSFADLVISECCYLQLRLSCECLAIACLAAQGDFETHRAFRDVYSPTEIFRALELSYPNFFPTPSQMNRIDENNIYFDDVGVGHMMTRREVETLWARSGDHLHRTSMKKYLKRTNAVDFIAITRAKEKLWNLLAGHMILLEGGTTRLHCSLGRETTHAECAFLFLDKEHGTARIEPYALEV